MGAGMDNPQNQPAASSGSEAPSPPARRVPPVSIGVALVVACLVLPLALGALSVTTEQAAGENAAREMEAPATAAPAATAQPNAQARPRLLDQHYYLVNGCVSAPVGCGKSTGDTWGEY